MWTVCGRSKIIQDIGFWKLERTRTLDKPVDWRILLKGILRVKGIRMWTRFIWLRWNKRWAFATMVMNLRFP